MRRTAVVLALLVVLVPTALYADGWDYPVWSLSFNGATTCVNAGSHTTLDDLPLGADGFTIEGWFRPDSYGEANSGAFFMKSGVPGYGYRFRYSASALYLYFGPSVAAIDTAYLPMGIWAHVAVTYNDLGDRTAYLWINGVQRKALAIGGSYGTDAASDLGFGCSDVGAVSMFGGLGWLRLSDIVRYTGTFEPPSRHIPSETDGHTVRLFRLDEGGGSVLADSSDNGIDATVTAGTWDYWPGPTDFGLGLGAWWDLEEESGTRYDAAGYSDLTDNNSVSQVTGRVNYAAGFEAGNFEYLSVPDNAAISSIYSVTVASWVYLDSIAADQEIVSKGDGANAEYQLYYDSGSNHFAFGAGDGASFTTVAAATPSPALTQTWYLVVGEHDPDTDQLLIQVYEGEAPEIYYPSASSYGLGGYNGSNPLYVGRAGATYYSGRADSVGYWRRDAINSDERAWLFNGGDGRAYTAFPPPTPTPVPTPTPDPNAYYVDLPSGKRGVWYASITAGESTIAAVLLAGLLLLVYSFMRETVLKWLQR